MQRRKALMCLAGLLLAGCAGQDRPIDPGLYQVAVEVQGMT